MNLQWWGGSPGPVRAGPREHSEKCVLCPEGDRDPQRGFEKGRDSFNICIRNQKHSPFIMVFIFNNHCFSNQASSPLRRSIF